MAFVEEPKRPSSAYFLYGLAVRDAIQKELNTKEFGPVTKLSAERWKTLSQTEKAKYDKEAADLKTKYEKDMAAYKAGGGEVGKARKEKQAAKSAKVEKAAKKEANADKPKRPAGGGYGVYMSKHREAIHKSLPAGSAVTVVSKVAGEKWKAMTEAEKKPYVEEYEQLKNKYDEEVKAWQETKGESAGDVCAEEAEASPEKATETSTEKPKSGAHKRSRSTSPAKEAGAAAQESPPVKKQKGRGQGNTTKSKDASPAIDADILAKASKLNLAAALQNLASRADMSKFPADKLLSALQDSNGLVNKAKAALLGA